MIKILSVFGTRPEAIKMPPVVRELERHPEAFESRVCVTAQHRQMLDQVLDFFSIVPDYDLDIMKRGQSLTDVTIAVLRGLELVLAAEQPDWILVQGDTTTVMAASIAAYYAKVRVGHVEAGLRTHDKYAPFPEEVSRRVTGVVADLHFAPTEWAAGNIRREGVPEERIVVTGNTVIDAIHFAAALSFNPTGTPLADLPVGQKQLILVTAHRRENFGRGMEEICAGLRDVAEAHPEAHLVCPIHLNSNVQEPIYRFLSNLPNITLLPPMDYRPFVWLLKQCRFVITDSGGLQEEAPGLGKSVLIMSDTTERPEGLTAGTARLIGAVRAEIVHWAGLMLCDSNEYIAMARAVNPYGDGHASIRIVEELSACDQHPFVSQSELPIQGNPHH